MIGWTNGRIQEKAGKGIKVQKGLTYEKSFPVEFQWSSALVYITYSGFALSKFMFFFQIL
jgi:hypothetical protein